jgi:hypothetical protein
MKLFSALSLLVWLAIPSHSCADELITTPLLDASEIINKNISARGGSEAWQKIQTMVWIGHIESAHAPIAKMPFVLEMKRPNKTRFEIKAQNQKSVRIFDGNQGWKMRPTSSGKPDLQQYTSEELRFARDEPSIGGLLMGLQSNATDVTLDGVEEVAGQEAYRLSIKLPSGVTHHVWVDTHSFLDIKYDREFINKLGQSVMVPVFNRNYQSMGGLQLPLLIETGEGATEPPDKLLIEKVLLNPPLEESVFAKPSVPQRRNAVTVNAVAEERPEDVR